MSAKACSKIGMTYASSQSAEGIGNLTGITEHVIIGAGITALDGIPSRPVQQEPRGTWRRFLQPRALHFATLLRKA